jgi:iron complex outermembrane receptor protein
MIRTTRLVHHLALACGGWTLLAASTALAQTTPPSEPQKLEKVEITGSSIRRIDAETALPVQILTREDIRRTGAATVEQLLQTVTAAASSGALPASASSGATTGNISSVSLRGLTSIRTLVLVNGRRISPYGIGFTNDSVSVDVNSIPVAALERVEILKDGASAIYGSDAIAGVVNLILRRDYQGAELSAEYGDTHDGGGGVQRVSGAWGFGDLARDRFNVWALVNYQREDALFGRDRDFASRGYNLGAFNDVTSAHAFPGNILTLDANGFFVNPGYPNNCAPSIVSPVYESRGPSGICRYDTSPRTTLFPEAERFSVFTAGRVAISSDVEGYAEISFSQNRQRTVIQPVPFSGVFTLPPNHPLLADPNSIYNQFGGTSVVLMSPASPFYPAAFIRGLVGANAALPDLFVLYRAVVNGDRDLTDTSRAPRAVLGVRGTFASWDFDTGVLWSQSQLRERTNGGFPSQVRILPLLNSGLVNLFGPNTPAIEAQLRATNFNGIAFTQWTSLTSLSARGTRDLVQLPGGPLAIALGAEVRKETYRSDPSPEIQAGDISGYGGNFLPVHRARNVTGAYTELNVPLFKGFEANLAARYDDYEGTGSKAVPKLGLRYTPLRGLLLRTSYGEGFRAPSLADLYAANTTGVTPNGLSDSLRCPTTGLTTDCNTQFPILQGGNPNLKPEESENITFGIVLEPTRNTSFAVDYFKIKLTDTIVNGVTAAVILSDFARYGRLVTRGPVQPNFPTLPGPIVQIDQTNINLGETRVEGFDIDWKWAIPAAELGKFTLGITGTYFKQFDVQNPDGSFTGAVDQVNASTGGLIPRWKHYASINWARGAWDVTLAQSWQGDYYDLPNSEPFGDQNVPRTVSSYTLYDTQVGYTGVKNLRLVAGIRNVLNTDPPYSNIGGQVVFQAGYDSTYADPRGRFYYVRATYQFK